MPNDREPIDSVAAEQRELLEETERLDGWLSRVEASGGWLDDAEHAEWAASMASLQERQRVVNRATPRSPLGCACRDVGANRGPHPDQTCWHHA